MATERPGTARNAALLRLPFGGTWFILQAIGYKKQCKSLDHSLMRGFGCSGEASYYMESV